MGSKMKYLIIIIIIMSADIWMSRVANRIVLARGADFDERVKSVSLDFSGEIVQGCEFGSVFYIYIYHTCFYGLQEDSGSREIPFFFYDYQRPVPLFIYPIYWFGKNAIYKEFIGINPLAGKTVKNRGAR
ncbi:hypothetical protein [Breoghania sp.]|uniref:hypothetical protein n=1 Tax=Breoghania sp. TaxID=2065378 RepID=UPI002AA6CA32|nr:hypothetical protein [Breoghania sp.]